MFILTGGNELKKYLVLIIAVFVLLSASLANAGSLRSKMRNLTMGVHAGYGVYVYDEHVSPTAQVNNPVHDEGAVRMNTVLFGASGEYSFIWPENVFAEIATDWVWGLTDEEEWIKDGSVTQRNDVSVFSQFYEGQIGYKNNIGWFNYSLYLSGGWDGMYFRRTDFADGNGVSKSIGLITEEMSLWRVGGGLVIGIEMDKWVLDGNIAYGYYFDGDVRNSSFGGVWFDTNGRRIDTGFGITREITEKLNISAGARYIFIELDQGSTNSEIFPNSETQIASGIINLTYNYE